MPVNTERGARLIVSFELADVRKHEGFYVPELTVEELLAAIEEYTRSACVRKGHYDEEISNAFLSVVDFAIADAAGKAVSALFAQLNTDKTALALENQDLKTRLQALEGGKSAGATEEIDDDIPF